MTNLTSNQLLDLGGVGHALQDGQVSALQWWAEGGSVNTR